MQTSTTTEAQVQEVTSAHPTMFDKWRWLPTVTDKSGLSKGAKVVALRLALHHNETTGLCNPTLQTLADELESSVPTIKRELAELRAAGFIDWKTGRNHKSSRYTLRQIRIHGPKGSDVPAYDVPPAKVPPAKRKDPASPSRDNVVRFPTTDPAPIVRSVVVSFPGSKPSPVPEMSPSDSSPVSPSDSSPVSPSDSSPVSPKYLKGNPSRGYTEGEGQKEVEGRSDVASVSPASPLCPMGGDGSSRTGEDEKQPDKQPEPVSQPADGKFTFEQIATPEWIAQRLDSAASSEAYHSGSGRTPNDPSVAKELLQAFRDLTTRAGIRDPEDRWNDRWTSFYNQKRPSDAAPKPTKSKRTGPAI